MSRTTRPSLEEYIQEQFDDAKECGRSTCTLFASDEEAMESKLDEMKKHYCTPRRGQYIVQI
jgi:hypothetical protein